MTTELERIARAALAAHDVDPDSELRLISVSENATFAVREPGGCRSALRVHRTGYHTRAAIESELSWIAALRSDGVVSTAEVLPARDGSRVVTVPSAVADQEPRHVVRFAWVDGEEPGGERLAADFRLLGEVTARLHEHARGWRLPAGFTRFRWDLETSIGAAGHWGRWQDGPGVGPQESALLGRLAGVLAARLRAFGAGADRFGLIHADLRLANLLVDPDGSAVHVIDFDDCGFGWYLYDLGASLSFIEDDPRGPELIDAWVTGYRTVLPLGAGEAAELPTFVLLRRLLLVAWIGSHPGTELAEQLGADFTRGSCELAEQYLTTFG